MNDLDNKEKLIIPEEDEIIFSGYSLDELLEDGEGEIEHVYN